MSSGKKTWVIMIRPWIFPQVLPRDFSQIMSCSKLPFAREEHQNYQEIPQSWWIAQWEQCLHHSANPIARFHLKTCAPVKCYIIIVYYSWFCSPHEFSISTRNPAVMVDFVGIPTHDIILIPLTSARYWIEPYTNLAKSVI